MLVDKIYSHVPVWLQNIGVSAYGYRWKKRRFGGIFKGELKLFKNREDYSKNQWREYQTIELRKILVHAFDTVPFYNKKYKEHGYTSSSFNRFELEDLKKLPYLEKDELRQFGKTTLLSSKKEKKGSFYYSSGSTGTPTGIYFSHSFHQRWSAAFEARIRHWAGIDRFHSRGMIGGRRIIKNAIAHPPFHRYNSVEKQAYFSAYHISPQNAPFYVDAIYKHNLQYMTGYAMSNYHLAKMILEQNLSVPKLKAVITSSEKLTPEMRAVFNKAYNCKTYDSYSGVEACGLISETKEGELLASPDVGILEVVNEDGIEVWPGETGEVISTGLLNYDQPLIRYRIGDRVTLSENQSTLSGIEMPVIKEINGRVEDKIIGNDGRVMVRFHGLYIDIQGLVAAQIVQESIGEFTFNLIIDKSYTAEGETIILKRLRSQLGEVKAIFNYLPEMPKNKNGKFQAVISKLKYS